MLTFLFSYPSLILLLHGLHKAMLLSSGREKKKCQLVDTGAVEEEAAKLGLTLAHYGPNPPTVSVALPNPEADLVLAVL